MDELNRNQLVLLVVLISFITSLATAIVVVSLLEETTETFPQTIYRVVEKTVEKVIPSEPITPTTIVKEVPIIATEEKSIIEAVNKVPNIFGRVWLNSGEDTQFLTPALRLSIKNKIYLIALLSEGSVGDTYFISFADGEKRKTEIIKKSKDNSLVLLKFPEELSESALANLEIVEDKIRIGQTTISINIDKNNFSILVGIISGVTGGDEIRFRTDIAENNQGAPILDTSGKLLGFSLGDRRVLSSSEVLELID